MSSAPPSVEAHFAALSEIHERHPSTTVAALHEAFSSFAAPTIEFERERLFVELIPGQVLYHNLSLFLGLAQWVPWYYVMDDDIIGGIDVTPWLNACDPRCVRMHGSFRCRTKAQALICARFSKQAAMVVDCTNVQVGDKVVAELRDHTSLEMLLLRGTLLKNMCGLIPDPKKYPDCVPSLPQLTELDISDTQFGNAGMEALTALPALQRLRASSLAALTDEGLASLLSAPALTSLDVSSCPLLTDAALRVVAKMPLSELYLAQTQCGAVASKCKFTRAGVTSLATALATTRKGYSCVTVLDLTQCPASSGTIRALTAITTLRTLSLPDCDAPWFVPSHLLELRSVKILSVGKVRLPDDVAASLSLRGELHQNSS